MCVVVGGGGGGVEWCDAESGSGVSGDGGVNGDGGSGCK